MPFTPFHFGPAATISLLAKKYIDLPAFILVNVAIDVEPLLVMLFNLNYPLHGYFHTFMFGSLVALLSGIILYFFKNFLTNIMARFGLPYKATLKKILISSVFGAWLHITLDATLYTDIKPFYPLNFNPLYGTISHSNVYLMCALFFIPAFFLFLKLKHQK